MRKIFLLFLLYLLPILDTNAMHNNIFKDLIIKDSVSNNVTYLENHTDNNILISLIENSCASVRNMSTLENIATYYNYSILVMAIIINYHGDDISKCIKDYSDVRNLLIVTYDEPNKHNLDFVFNMIENNLGRPIILSQMGQSYIIEKSVSFKYYLRLQDAFNYAKINIK